MPRFAAFHQCLYCLQKYPSLVPSLQIVLTRIALTLLRPMDYSINFLIQLSQYGPLYISRGHMLYFPNILLRFFSLMNGFVKANSADPDEMPRSAAFHLDLHCLQ